MERIIRAEDILFLLGNQSVVSFFLRKFLKKFPKYEYLASDYEKQWPKESRKWPNEWHFDDQQNFSGSSLLTFSSSHFLSAIISAFYEIFHLAYHKQSHLAWLISTATYRHICKFVQKLTDIAEKSENW